MINSTFYIMLPIAAVMGFSIYLSFPFAFKNIIKEKYSLFLISFAVGILIFLIGDIFSDVSSLIYSGNDYIANPQLSLIFIASVGILFLIIYEIEKPRSIQTGAKYTPSKVALIISLGMGLQNLTEGLVFGASYSLGIESLFIVILVGFILQNFTEGFPILSPFLGNERPNVIYIASLYFIGGFPTILGSIIGYFYTNVYMNIAFDGSAIGAIIYVLIPMTRNIFKQAERISQYGVLYSGILIGFICGFAVNII